MLPLPVHIPSSKTGPARSVQVSPACKGKISSHSADDARTVTLNVVPSGTVGCSHGWWQPGTTLITAASATPKLLRVWRNANSNGNSCRPREAGAKDQIFTCLSQDSQAAQPRQLRSGDGVL